MKKKRKKINSKNILRDLYLGKQVSMLAELGAVRKGVFHAPTMGDASENKWRKFFLDHLPKRYQIEKAHVIDSNGTLSQQIDCVIFDRQYSSFVFNQDGILYVPAESVYAVFELKQEITKAHLEYAAEKIKSVRDLKRTSIPVPQISGKAKRKKLAPIIGGLIAVESKYSPPFGLSAKSIIKGLKGKKKIDFLFSLKDGLSTAAEYPEIGLILFLNELLSSLQKTGNAPAIDYQKYSSIIKK